MKILPWMTRSTSKNDENPDPEFWAEPTQHVDAWPGKPNGIRRLSLPPEDPNLLTARPDTAGGREYAAALAEAEYEFAVMQNLQMLEAN